MCQAKPRTQRNRRIRRILKQPGTLDLFLGSLGMLFGFQNFATGVFANHAFHEVAKRAAQAHGKPPPPASKKTFALSEQAEFLLQLDGVTVEVAE